MAALMAAEIIFDYQKPLSASKNVKKKHIIAVGELEVVQKHELRFCLMAAIMAAALWNIGSTISMLI